MRRLRKALTAVLVAAALVGVAAPVEAYWIGVPAPSGYFDRFTWGGTVLNAKGFYIADRTGSTLHHQALQEFVNYWNWELETRGLAGELPTLAYALDDAYIGNCTNGSSSAGPLPYNQTYGNEFSIVVACAGTPVGTFLGFSRGAGVVGGRHIREYGVFPYAYCSSSDPHNPPYTLTQAQLVRCWAHEIGHLMGFPHNDTYGHLMEGPHASGIWGLSWFTSADFGYLLGVYPAPNQD